MASLAELDTSSYITELDKTPCIHEVFSTTDIPDIPQIRKEIEVPNNALSIISKEFINQPENIKNPTDICIVNTRVFLDELSEKYNKPITIGTIPEEEWQELFKDHTSFWFMGIYKESQAGQDFCQKNPYCIRDVEYEIRIPIVLEMLNMKLKDRSILKKILGLRLFLFPNTLLI